MPERKKRENFERRESIHDRMMKTEKGRKGLKAVKATFDATKLINNAMEESNTSRDELAEKLEVSRERVDEILDVFQGNVRVTTLARILSVCGFDLNISSNKVE